MKHKLKSRLQALEAALTPNAQPSTALWLLKGETIEDGVERYRREGIALARYYFPISPALTMDEWLEKARHHVSGETKSEPAGEISKIERVT